MKFTYDQKPALDAPELTAADYRPCCGTPLYDALGKAMTTIWDHFKHLEDGFVIVTVITDGYENSSKRYTLKEVQDLVNDLKNKGWIFTYMGANQDSSAVARAFSMDNARDFEYTDAGLKNAYDRDREMRELFYAKLDRLKRDDQTMKQKINRIQRLRKYKILAQRAFQATDSAAIDTESVAAPSDEKPGIVILGVPMDCTKDFLQTLLSNYHPTAIRLIPSKVVPGKPAAQSAFVDMNTSDDVSDFIAVYRTLTINNRQCRVEIKRPKTKHLPPADIIISNLPATCTSKQLEELFKMDEVISARVIVDKDTQTSKGFGFIKCQSIFDREIVLAQHRTVEIDGQTATLKAVKRGTEESITGTIRKLKGKEPPISPGVHSPPPPKPAPHYQPGVVVKNVPAQCGEEYFNALFAAYQPITLKFLTPHAPQGAPTTSKTVFVYMQSEEHADGLLRTLTEIDIDGVKCPLEKIRSASKPPAPKPLSPPAPKPLSPPPDATKKQYQIHVSNLPFSITNAQMKDIFSKLPGVTDAYIIKDKNTHKSKGFGYVCCESAEARAALLSAHPTMTILSRDCTLTEGK